MRGQTFSQERERQHEQGEQFAIVHRLQLSADRFRDYVMPTKSHASGVYSQALTPIAVSISRLSSPTQYYQEVR